MLYGEEGDIDSAFVWFDRQKTWGIQATLSMQSDRRLGRLRAEPRYRVLLSRIGITAM
jgi:hypothetical protein